MEFEFFKNPYVYSENNNSFIQKIKELFNSLLWMYGLIFICTLFLKVIDFFVYKSTKFSFYDSVIIQQNKNFGNYPIYYIIILAPIVEEIIFRLPLTLKKKHLIFSLISCAFYLFFNKLLSGKGFSEINNFVVIFLLILALLIYFLLKEKEFDFVRKSFYPLFFYSICTIFGLMHLFNFCKVVPVNLILIAPLFVIPQLILGYFSGYLRLKNGFFWGLLLHIIFNIPSGILLYHR